MRAFLLFMPVVLMAQSTPPPKAPAAAPKSTTGAPSTAPAKKSSPAATKTGATPAKPAAPPPMTDEQKTIYALGLSMYRSLAQFSLSPAELDLVKRALTDAAAGKPAVEVNEWMSKIQPLAAARAARV